MTYDFLRLLNQMAELCHPEKEGVGIIGLAFTPARPEAPHEWHFRAWFADGSSYMTDCGIEEPTPSKKGTMMSAYEAATIALRNYRASYGPPESA